jgi:hypothetical protein
VAEENPFSFKAFDFSLLKKERSTTNLEIPKNLVLGKRAEIFFAEAIKQSSRFQIIAHNLQVIQHKKTFGEFDFFLKDKVRNKPIHVELVYKFYVYDPSFNNELDRWIGPNRKDTLVKKMERLKNHQLPLLYKKESEFILKKYNLPPEKMEQQVCFLANLFVPRHLLQHKFSFINPSAIIGYWLKKSEFTEAEYGKYSFYSPKKPDWPVHPKLNNNWKSFEAILEEVNFLFQHQKATFLWMKKNEHTYERFFVVWW